MGCGFDSSLVWSSTETSPEVCETDASQQATSYASCGDFISALEQLYAGRPDAFAAEENPLRLNAVIQARSDFENVHFPTRFNWIIDQTNGIASLDDTGPYLYDFEGPLLPTISEMVGKTVFVTSETYTGNLGGLAGADAKCQERANDAGLPGTYKAWLSASTNSVSERFDRSFDDFPFVRTDGVRIANNWGDLTDGTLLVAIDRNEFGNSGGVDRVWTNSDASGDSAATENDPTLACYDWTSTSGSSFIGDVTATSSRQWALFTSGPCNNQYRLYCFQQVSFGPNLNDPSPQFPTHYTEQLFFFLGGNTGEILEIQLDSDATPARTPKLIVSPLQEPTVLEEKSTSDLFCGVNLGPPTVLAQACDASMDFLLGPSVSIGMLTSTAKAVNGESLDFDFFRTFV